MIKERTKFYHSICSFHFVFLFLTEIMVVAILSSVSISLHFRYSARKYHSIRRKTNCVYVFCMSRCVNLVDLYVNSSSDSLSMSTNDVNFRTRLYFSYGRTSMYYECQ